MSGISLYFYLLRRMRAETKTRFFFFFFAVLSFYCNAQSLPNSVYPPDTLTIAYHSTWTKTHYREKIRAFKKDPLEKDDIVFLGNSITEQGGDWGTRIGWEQVKNRGISGDVTEGVLNRLREVKYVKPKAVFLLIGINDIFNLATTPQYVAGNILAIAKALRKALPHTKLYVQTILPTTTISIREKIQRTNTLLRKKARRKLYKLLDTHALFADETDLMKKEYTKDGVHLNEKGYAIWVEFLKKELPNMSN